jgi:hypothetical protein
MKQIITIYGFSIKMIFRLLFVTRNYILLCALFFDLTPKTNILLSVVVVGSGCTASAVDFPILDRYLMQTK